eukprot:1157751-Pelagomonas_calceolata.AAC.10
MPARSGPDMQLGMQAKLTLCQALVTHMVKAAPIAESQIFTPGPNDEWRKHCKQQWTTGEASLFCHDFGGVVP